MIKTININNIEKAFILQNISLLICWKEEKKIYLEVFLM